MKTLKLYLGLSAFVLGAFVQTSCETKRSPSVLLIAVDSLPFNLSLCTREENDNSGGFQTLCKESIRFTHAMTPSPLSVPALASLMTGLYPFEHGIRTNGSTGLSPRFYTFAEAAVRKGYRTSFFSGGPPVWRRSGLHQGFELFDDLLNFSSGQLFRPFGDSIQLFQHWLKSDVGDDPFVATIYIPDLNFTNTVTENISGEPRSLSFDSQLEEMDESLGELIQFLKNKNRWDDTLVVFTGLNGRETTYRSGEIEPINLHSENTQVVLLIKPDQKPRDDAINWTIDRNVSLADVGRSLLKKFEPTKHENSEGDFPLISLSSSLTNSQPDWPESRSILIESGWGAWQEVTGLRAAVLRNHELTMFDFPAVMYNTLTDRFETIPIPQSSIDPALLSNLRQKGFRSWTPLAANFQKTFSIAPILWLSPSRAKELHRSLTSLSLDDFAHPRIIRWAAQSALDQKDWKLLKQLGKKMNMSNWTAVADINLGKKAKLTDPCLRIFQSSTTHTEDVRNCTDELTLSFFRWKDSKKKSSQNKDANRRRFQRGFEGYQIDLKILKANAGFGLIWLPMSAEEGIPSKISLAMALPDLNER